MSRSSPVGSSQTVLADKWPFFATLRYEVAPTSDVRKRIVFDVSLTIRRSVCINLLYHELFSIKVCFLRPMKR